MARFSYVVRDSGGKSISGAMEANDRNQVAQKLRADGMLIVRIAEGGKAGEKGGPDLFARLTGKVGLRELAVFSKQFAAMINSGLNMIRCLRVLEQQTNNVYFKDIIGKIRDEVSAGSPLSTALAMHQKSFSRLYISMIKSGEESGSLDTTLNRLAVHLEKEVSLRDQISAAMKYPQAIMFVMIVVVSFLMINVIPVFARMFEGLGSALPTPTKILMAISNSMRGYWYIYLAIVIAIPAIKRAIENTPSGKLAFDKARLRFPVFGMLNKKIAVARFSRTLGTLLQSGVPIITALQIVEEVAGNVVIEAAILKVRNSIKEGATIAVPLEASGVFPPMVTNMIAVGEESGSLDDMLNKIADFYDAEVETMVKGLTALLEPLMITVMGVMVGGIVIALLLPLFKMIEVLRDMA